MLWRAGSSYRGSMDYLQKQQTPLAFSQITWGMGKASSLPAQTTGWESRGKEGGCAVSSEFILSIPCLLAGQLFPNLLRYLPSTEHLAMEKPF